QRGRLSRRRPLLLELVGEGATVAELQREERLAAHLADFVQLHDVRVLQAGHRFRLDLEAQPFCWAGVLKGADRLQRHQAVGPQLPRPVDDPHAAVAADPQDLVAGDLRVFAALPGRQVRGHGPGVTRPLRRGVVGRTGRRQAISRGLLIHGPLPTNWARIIHAVIVLPSSGFFLTIAAALARETADGGPNHDHHDSRLRPGYPGAEEARKAPPPGEGRTPSQPLLRPAVAGPGTRARRGRRPPRRLSSHRPPLATPLRAGGAGAPPPPAVQGRPGLPKPAPPRPPQKRSRRRPLPDGPPGVRLGRDDLRSKVLPEWYAQATAPPGLLLSSGQ